MFLSVCSFVCWIRRFNENKLSGLMHHLAIILKVNSLVCQNVSLYAWYFKKNDTGKKFINNTE